MSETVGSFRCSEASQARGEDLAGTASRIDRWMLVECSGPWGDRALPQSRGINDDVLLGLQERARRAHARTLLIRRVGAVSEPGSREVFAADSRPGFEVLLRRHVASDAELAAIEPPFDGDRSGWTEASALIGVCTHGKHDVCCAVRGRPVAAALAEAFPDLAYEVSHLGGDRFAGNVLVLPGGHYLGRVTPDNAREAVGAVLAGQRPADHYRGRSVWPPSVQAAQHFAAAHLGETSLDALPLGSIERLADHSWRIEFGRASATPISVVVERTHEDFRAQLTCHAETENHPPRWNLVAVS